MMKTELLQNNLMLKDIPGYEGLYAITSNGEVWSYIRKKWLKLKTTYQGYKSATLTKEGKQKEYLVHRLVWETFNGPIPNTLVINHKNEIRNDNRLENLEVCTVTYNNNYGTRIEKQRISSLYKGGKGIKFKDEKGNLYSFVSYSQANDVLCPDKCKGYFKAMFANRKDGVFSLNGNKYFL